MSYVAPALFAKSFTCPHCDVYSNQEWFYFDWNGESVFQKPKENHNMKVSRCQHCGKTTVWVYDLMVYPDRGNAPAANPDMPENVRKLYEEASSISAKSPRGACALLRLAIQLLCVDLGGEGKDINKDIGKLVADGLSPIVQKSLDVVRVTGNEAVHPGQIDTDNPETAMQLFGLLNIIVDYMISMPNRVTGLYDSLPAGKLNGIDDRDKNSQ